MTLSDLRGHLRLLQSFLNAACRGVIADGNGSFIFISFNNYLNQATVAHKRKLRAEQTDNQASTCRWVFTARLRPQFRMPPVRRSLVRIRGMMRTQHFWISTSSTATAAAAPARRSPVLTQHAMIGGRLPEWQTLKCISSISFVRIELFFYKTQET